MPTTRPCRKRSSACASSCEAARGAAGRLRWPLLLAGGLRQPRGAAPRTPTPPASAWSGRLVAARRQRRRRRPSPPLLRAARHAAGRRTDADHARSAAPWPSCTGRPARRCCKNGSQTRRFDSVDALIEAATGAADPGRRAVRLAGRPRRTRCPAGRPTCRQLGDGRLQAHARVAAAARPTCASSSNARMKALYDLPAPAKLNLFLHITGRRADGYHLLQSVFMLIDWCDTLHFERRGDGAAQPRRPRRTPLPADDLVLRAARALQAATRHARRARTSAIAKRVPAQAGMGGGSSDAATCLLALNRLWGLTCRCATLEQIGLALGADVPFFLRGRNAWVEGIGEKITPDRPAAGALRGGQAARGTGHRGDFCSDRSCNAQLPAAIISGFAAKHAASDRVRLRSQRPAAGCPAGFAPRSPKPSNGSVAKDLQGRMTGSGSAVFRSDAAGSGNWPSAARRAGRFGNAAIWPSIPWRDGHPATIHRLSGCILQTRPSTRVGESPSWLRHWILIPACEGSNPSSPAKSSLHDDLWRLFEEPFRIAGCTCRTLMQAHTP